MNNSQDKNASPDDNLGGSNNKTYQDVDEWAKSTVPDPSAVASTWLIDQGNLVKPKVQLVGEDGNAFSIMGRVVTAWRKMGRSDIVAEYRERATAGDYDNLLAVTMEYVDRDALAGGPEDEEDDLLGEDGYDDE